MSLISPKKALTWIGLILGVSLVVGAAGAGFHHALTGVTRLYQTTPWLIVSLPFLGLLTLWLYRSPCLASAGGTKTLIAQIREPAQPLPGNMAPAILGTTLLSHLGGASVGREGTALQMGGALADQFSRWVDLNPNERRTLLLCGVSAGFAAVFGTPFAAAIFALEFVRLRSWAVLPCLVCGFGADLIGRKLFHLTHANYQLPLPAEFSGSGLASALALGLACGLVAKLYLFLSQREAARPNPLPYARIFFTGLLFSLSIYFTGYKEFTGLGLPIIETAMLEPMSPFVFILKFLFTLVCVSAGFRGGEVTPLFFIGVTLGSAAATYCGLPLSICAALGFVGVFAGAGAVPLACTVMACELFGPSLGLYALITCAVSWLVAGRKGLYA